MRVHKPTSINARHWMAQARALKNLKQEDLAVICGITTTLISRYENGYHEPRLQTVWKIEDILGIDWRKCEEQNKLILRDDPQIKDSA